MPVRRCVGALLAGGAASRMGGAPKGLELVGGRRIADRAADALRQAADDLVLVVGDRQAPAWLPGVRAVPDARPGLGALGGIHAALTAAAGADVLVLPWDAPFVPAPMLRALREAGELAEADVAAPRSRSPWGFEPLCAWYAASALEHVTALLDAGDGRAGALARRCRHLVVDVSSWGRPDDIFFNVNTPTDLDRARAIAARLGAP
jgi:molybdopterin-guanine dinucleotide biosynthesis protein A